MTETGYNNIDIACIQAYKTIETIWLQCVDAQSDLTQQMIKLQVNDTVQARGYIKQREIQGKNRERKKKDRKRRDRREREGERSSGANKRNNYTYSDRSCVQRTRKNEQ